MEKIIKELMMKKLFIFMAVICLFTCTFVGCKSVTLPNPTSTQDVLKDPEQLGYRMGKISWYIYNYMKMNPKYTKEVGQIETFWERLTSTNDVPNTAVICEMITNIAASSLTNESNTMERILIMEAANYATAVALQNIDTETSDKFVAAFIKGIEDGKKVYVYEDLYEKEVDSIIPFECGEASKHCEFSGYRKNNNVIFQDAVAKKLLTYDLNSYDKGELEDFRILMRHYHDNGVSITKVTIDAAVIDEVNGRKQVTKLIFILDTGAKPYDEQIAEIEARIAVTTDELSLERLNASLKTMKEEQALGIDPKYVEYSCIRCIGEFPDDKVKKK